MEDAEAGSVRHGIGAASRIGLVDQLTDMKFGGLNGYSQSARD